VSQWNAECRRCRRSARLECARSRGTTPFPAPAVPVAAAARAAAAPCEPARLLPGWHGLPVPPASPPAEAVRRHDGSARHAPCTCRRSGPGGSGAVPAVSGPGCAPPAAADAGRSSLRAPAACLPPEPRSGRPDAPGRGPDGRSRHGRRRSSGHRPTPHAAPRPGGLPGSPDPVLRTSLQGAFPTIPSPGSPARRPAPHRSPRPIFLALRDDVGQAGHHEGSLPDRLRRAWRSRARRGVPPRSLGQASLRSATPRRPDAHGRRPE